jgi:predicted kinase
MWARCCPTEQASAVAVIVVSGPPASGKTWWGRRHTSGLSVPYLNRDDFKAPVYPVFAEFGVPPGRAAVAGRELWLTAMSAVLDAGVPVVADGVFNFDEHIHAFRRYIDGRSERCFEIRLRADPDVLLRRFVERADPPLVESLRPSVVAATRRSYPAIIEGAPAVEVDSTDLSAIDDAAVLGMVRQWLATSQPEPH